MAIAFASAADLDDKVVSFTELVKGRAYAYTAQGDPNTGVIVGDRATMVIDTQATPIMARDVLAKIATVSPTPVTHVLLSHYHAVRVLGASAYGAHTVIASSDTLALMVERGEQDKASEIARFPRLFRGVDSVPAGLTWPSLAFNGALSLDLGGIEVQIFQLGRGHTKGDTVAWLPEHKVLFAGDLVEFGTTPYTGDAYLTEWPSTLDHLGALGAHKLVPGRGDALQNPTEVSAAITQTRGFLVDLLGETRRFVANGGALREVYKPVHAALQAKYGEWVIFEHCMPFDISRAYDEANGIEHPRIWTAQRDQEMWNELNA
jgi:glyoxylase-like metal-dependent hydrolase (beta-lactamase superfamily II)